MKNTILKFEPSIAQDLSTLEGLLGELSRFGKPSLWIMDSGGWYCKVEMFIQGEGICFDVKSESNHKTPTGAARQCFDRMNSALRDITEKTK